MSGWRYVLGFAFLSLLLTSVGFTAHRLRARYLRSWAGPLAVLAELVIALWLVVVLAQLLGMLGILRLIPLVTAALALALGSRLKVPLEGSAQTDEEPDVSSRRSRSARLSVAVAFAGAALVLRSWWRPTHDALNDGIVGYDSLWTHLPFAANIFQRGTVVGSYFPGSLPETYLPLNSELLHSIGMAAFQSDVLSPLFSLGWAALALLAGWCFAARWNVAPLGMLSAAVVLDFPVLRQSQPGQAMSDVVVLALLLCSLALLVNADGSRPALLLAAGAAGLAMGTQVTSLLVVLALSVGAIVLCQREKRWTGVAIWGVGLLSTGGLWYARNAFLTGNPLPWVKLGVARFSLPTISSSLADCGNAALVDRWSDQVFRKSVLGPALATGLGSKWLAVALLAGAGLIGGFLLLRPGCQRLPAIVGAAAIVGYLLTPATAGPPANAFHCTAYNTRFVVFGMACGLLCLGAVVSRHRGVAAALLMAVVVLLVQLDSDARGSLLARGIFVVGVTLVVFGTLGGTRRRSLPRLPARWGRTMLIVGCMVTAAAAWPVADRYATRRYAAGPSLPPSVRGVAAWAQGITGSSIAVAGTFMSYPLYGPDISNRVVYPHLETRRGTFELANDCATWRALLREGRYDYVVVVAEGSVSQPREAAWTAEDAGAEPVFRDGPSTVFRFDSRTAVAPCTR